MYKVLNDISGNLKLIMTMDFRLSWRSGPDLFVPSVSITLMIRTTQRYFE